MINWGVKLLSTSRPSIIENRPSSGTPPPPPPPQIDWKEQYFISKSTTCSQQCQSRNHPCTLCTLPIRCSIWYLPLLPGLHHFEVLLPFARYSMLMWGWGTLSFFCLSTWNSSCNFYFFNSPNHVQFFVTVFQLTFLNQNNLFWPNKPGVTDTKLSINQITASNLGLFKSLRFFFYPYLSHPQAVLIQDIKQATDGSLKTKPPFGLYILVICKTISKTLLPSPPQNNKKKLYIS